MRDDFSQAVKDELAKRVAYRCSNPECRHATSGPQEALTGTVNIGVAAHITSAAAGGPRHDQALTQSERRSGANGIWLCQICAKLIDSDLGRYTVAKLTEWRVDAERTARSALEERRAGSTPVFTAALEAERLMGDLVSALRISVRADATELLRTFVVLPSRQVLYSPSRPELYFLESDIPNLRLKVEELEDLGLVVDISTGNLPKYRIAAEFAAWLRHG